MKTFAGSRRRRTASSGALLLVLYLAWASPARGEVPVVRLDVLTPAPAMGSGFLVRDWRPEHEAGVLLVTALHVVQGATGISVSRVQCAPYKVTELLSLTRATRVLVWPELDVAAFALEAPPSGISPGRIDPLAQRPAGDLVVHVQGFSGLDRCGEGGAFFMGNPSVEELATSVAANLKVAREDVRGDLDPSATLYQYFGPAAPGTSGGPVSWSSREGVVAVHHAGLTDRAVSWAVCLSTIPGRTPQELTLQQLGAMRYRKAALNQSLEQAPESDRVRATRWAFRQAADWSLAFVFMRRVGADAITWWGPRAGVAMELYRFPAGTLDNALGARFAFTGPTFGRASSVTKAPTGQVLTSESKAVRGWMLDGSGELRFLRARSFRPTIGIGVRVSSLVTDSKKDPNWGRLRLGIPVHARVSWSLLPPPLAGVSLSGELQAAYERSPISGQRFTGVGGQVRPLEAPYGISWGVAVGLEF